MAERPYRYLDDVYSQPASLIRSLHGLQAQTPIMAAAAEWLRAHPSIVVAGIGSSYNAALAMEAMLDACGTPVKVVDGTELAYAPRLPRSAGLIIVSRSGASVELVRLVHRCLSEGISYIAITNAPDSPVAASAHLAIDLRTDFDHCISLRMYTALQQALIVLGFAIAWPRSALPIEELMAAWRQVDAMLPEWHDTIEHDGDFFAPGSTLYMLARGMDLANAWEGRLLMEECGKSGATVMPTGAFRHGPQEVLSPLFRSILWLPSTKPVHGYDFALAESIAGLGGRGMLIGRELPASANSHLKFELPPAPEFAAALFGVIPVQLGAYLLSVRKGKNPDELVYCPYVVTTEGAL
ncbi:MAG: SIS domain-containing protein [Anaerolineales bacterium]|nr:SIS domain-containing protein [Anaerolineales bacterium]